MHSKTTTAMTVVILILSIAATSGTAMAQESETILGIKGYSPVSYFEHGRAEIGDPAYAATFNQRIYHFTSPEQLALFEADPRRYAPMFPDHCPYNLSLGRRAAIDPHSFKIVNGHLLLFHKTEEMNSREQWQAHGNDEELLERAKSQYTLFRF